MSRKLSDLGVHVQQGAYTKLPTALRLVTSSMTSRDDVILVTSQCGFFKHTLKKNAVLKHEHIWIINFVKVFFFMKRMTGSFSKAFGSYEICST